MSIDECNRIGYIFIMIKNFSHKGLEGFFYNDDKSGIQPKHAQKIADVLDRLEASNLLITIRRSYGGKKKKTNTSRRNYKETLLRAFEFDYI